MNSKLQKIFDARAMPVLTEEAVNKMEKMRPFGPHMTPLHGIYAEFVHTSCYEHCFNKAEYYHNRCMPSLCFARWLVLHGYAKFNYVELRDSIKDEDKPSTR